MAALVAAAMSTPAADAAASSTVLLTAGHSLGAGPRSKGYAPSHEFSVEVYPGRLEIDEQLSLNSTVGVETVTWFINRAVAVGANDQTYLALQADGNLVLYSQARKALWSSNTAGSGAGNRLVIQNDGNLVMYAANNRALWASGTTRIFLGPGNGLASGTGLVFRDSAPGGGVTRLIMQRDGNLVVYLNGLVRWQSATHVTGSRLVMQSDGNLVIYSPTNHATWSSRTSGRGPLTWATLYQGGFFIETDRSSPVCDFETAPAPC